MQRRIRSAVAAALALAVGAGGLAVLRPAVAQVNVGTLIETLTVCAGDASPCSTGRTGTTTGVTLDAFATYRIVAEGSFAYDPAGRADAECTTATAGSQQGDTAFPQPGWQRYRFLIYPTDFLLSGQSPSWQTTLLDLWDPDPTDDPVDLYVDNRQTEWLPEPTTNPSQTELTGCSDAHRYSTLFSPTESRRVNFRIVDLNYVDNAGSLTVRVYRLTGSIVPPFPKPARLVETVVVHSHVPGGARTGASLQAGRPYALLAHGLYNYAAYQQSLGALADVACTRTPADPLYRRDRFGGDAAELWVDGAPVEWRPVAPVDPVDTLPGVPALTPVPTPGPTFPPDVRTPLESRCDRIAHYYWLPITGTGSPIDLHIRDGNHADNIGSISVEVFELAGPVATPGPVPTPGAVCVIVSPPPPQPVPDRVCLPPD